MKTSRKADACVRAVASVILMPETRLGSLSCTLREELGAGWTLVSALQWLTGRTARDYFASLPATATVGGVPTKALPMIVEVAKEACSMLGRRAPTEEQAAESLRQIQDKRLSVKSCRKGG